MNYRYFLKQCRQYLFVIRQIDIAEEKRHINGTRYGKLWNILSPLLYMIILSIYYQNIVVHDEIDKFPVFVFTGYIMYNFISIATRTALKSIVCNKYLLIKSKIPIHVFIVQKTVAAFRELLYSLVALIPIIIIFKVSISVIILEIIPLFLLVWLFVTGVGSILAVLYVYFADIEYLYSLLMTMLFFVSGVFVPLNSLPIDFQPILTNNPIFLAIYIFRNSVMYSLKSHWTAWVKLLCWTILVVIIGFMLINKKKDDFINKI